MAGGRPRAAAAASSCATRRPQSGRLARGRRAPPARRRRGGGAKERMARTPAELRRFVAVIAAPRAQPAPRAAAGPSEADRAGLAEHVATVAARHVAGVAARSRRCRALRGTSTRSRKRAGFKLQSRANPAAVRLGVRVIWIRPDSGVQVRNHVRVPPSYSLGRFRFQVGNRLRVRIRARASRRPGSNRIRVTIVPVRRGWGDGRVARGAEHWNFGAGAPKLNLGVRREPACQGQVWRGAVTLSRTTRRPQQPSATALEF